MNQIAGTPPHEFTQLFQADAEATKLELRQGLLATPAAIAPKFLYDTLGSRLFEAICALPEYYPTRTEAGIFDAHIADIAESCGQGATLIDLGAGNCAKAARLFPYLQPAQYVPVDISVDFLREAVAGLQCRFPAVRMSALGLDFSRTLNLPASVSQHRRLFFYPGSSIGNFSPSDALAFLRRVRFACADGGGLLIGVDLIKDKTVLDAAYADALGVTAAFNLNLLLHVNAVLGTDFDVRHWRHRAFFNEAQRRVEMYLEARRNVTVRWKDGERRFAEGERIHTENSYKFTRGGFIQLLEEAGFGDIRAWSDAQDWFLVCHARAA